MADEIERFAKGNLGTQEILTGEKNDFCERFSPKTIVELEKENKFQKDKIQKLTKQIERQFLEINELHKKNHCIYVEMGRLEEELANRNKQLKLLEEGKNNLTTVCVEKEKLLEEKKKNSIVLETKCNQLEHELLEIETIESGLRDKLQQIENSKSWRITKPLRLVLNKLYILREKSY